MRQLSLKYNPGLSSDEELKQLFVVRQSLLNLILETIVENSGPSNQHILLVGPRGIGKTTLVRRAVAEIRTNSTLNKLWFPIVFAEESYDITTPGEFWLEALYRLAVETDEETWKRSHRELQLEGDELRLRERALGYLIRFASQAQKRLLLVVENLNMLVRDQLSDNDAWDLRHTLLNEPAIMLLGTATSNLFSDLSNAARPWFELFAIHRLEPLNTEECSIMWRSLTGQDLRSEQVRPIHILTGGNPRLVRILAEFADRNSFRNLMTNLIGLIDDHTEYFKSQLDSLPAAERKVFVVLLEAWEPATAQNIGKLARLGINKASANLSRLVSRGAVSVVEEPGRKKLYQAAERLYNIYYLMRRRGDRSNRVRAAVRFMMHFYRGDDLVKSTARLAQEACRLEPSSRRDHYLAYEEIVSHAAVDRERLLNATPQEFFESPDLPIHLRELVEAVRKQKLETVDTITGLDRQQVVHTLLREGLKALRKNETSVDAEQLFRKAIEVDPTCGHAWAHLGECLMQGGRLSEARKALDHAVALAPDDDWAWAQVARLCEREGKRDDALNSIGRAVELHPRSPLVWSMFGSICHDVERYAESEHGYRQALKYADNNRQIADAWDSLAELLHYHLHRYEEAKDAYLNSLKAQPAPRGWTLLLLAELLQDQMNDSSQAKHYFSLAEKYYRELTLREPTRAGAWGRLGQALQRDPLRLADAEAALRKAIRLESGDSYYADRLVGLLANAGRFEDAESLCRDLLKSHPGAESWRRLGWLFERQRNYSDAEAAYKHAVDEDPTSSFFWSCLADAQIANGSPEKLVEAKRALVKAVGLGGSTSLANIDLLRVRLSLGEPVAEIEADADHFMEKAGRIPDYLVDIATKFVGSGRLDILHYCEKLAEEAFQKSPGKWRIAELLLTILSRLRQWERAVAICGVVFDAAPQSGRALRRSVDFAVLAAAAGFGQCVLQILQNSKGKSALEPLDIGIRQFLGEKVVSPAEISEMAADVVNRIKAASLVEQTHST